MQNFLLALTFALMAYAFIHTKGTTGKFLITILFGIISYLIMEATIDQNRDLVVNYGEDLGSRIAWKQGTSLDGRQVLDPDTAVGSQIIPEVKVIARDLRFGALYDQEIGFDVTAIENKYIVNDIQQPVITMVRGNIYKFRIPNGVYGEFPFYFSKTNTFGGNYQDSEFISGLSRHQDNDFIDIVLSITTQTPDIMYYHSGTQRNMGGKIEVINEKIVNL